MTRNISQHKSNAVNEQIDITADDRDEHNGNSSHVYVLSIGDRKQADPDAELTIKFQRGSLHEPHSTGITNESLLAILIDRMQGFQSGRWSCRENAIALTKLQEAMMWLQERTRQRQLRGVEGTSAE